MTQNKKFKKLVRARMAETGATYMQARRALDDGREVAIPQTLRRIGYWYSKEQPHLPDPLDMVSKLWNPGERAKVVVHLKRGHMLLRSILDTWCRLGCGTGDKAFHRAFFEGQGVRDRELPYVERLQARKLAAKQAEEANMTGEPHVNMGRADLTDGVYVWPEGLVHYLEHHNVRLPPEFVEHVLKNPLPPRPEGDFVAVHPFLRLADRKLWDESWWVAQGGSTKKRHEILNDSPSVLEVETPFNAGWYFHDAEYPDEGSGGPFDTYEEAKLEAQEVGYDPHDPDSVKFFEQKKPAPILQRFAMEHIRNELLTTLHEFEGKENTFDVQQRIQRLLTDRFQAVVKKLESEGVLTPSEKDIGMEFTGEANEEQGKCRARMWLKHPERYPDLVRDLTEAAIIERRYLISIMLKEGE